MTTRLASPQAFRTYGNYLRAWRIVLAQTGATPVEFTWDLPSQRQVSATEEAALTGALHRYWGNLRALAILNTGGVAAEVLAVHPPIAYYALHNASRAMLLAMQNQASDSHGGVLNQISQLCQLGHFQAPWSASCQGAPKDQIINGLGPFAWPQSNLSTVTEGNALGFVALSLKTTRIDAIDLSLYGQRSNKLRLPRGTRKKKEQVLRPTNVFDMFYRYRRIAHYGKADVFTAFQTEDDGILFGETLLAVVDAACWTLERKLHERVGSALMISWYDAYMAQHDIVAGEGPVGRRFSGLVAPF